MQVVASNQDILRVVAVGIACFFNFFCPSQATILQLPRLFVKESAEAAALGAAEPAGARAAKPVAARAQLEGEEIKRLPQGGSLAVLGAGGRGLPPGGHRMVPAGHHHGEGKGGWRGRQASPFPPMCGLWGKRPNGPMPLRGKWLLLFCVCLG